VCGPNRVDRLHCQRVKGLTDNDQGVQMLLSHFTYFRYMTDVHDPATRSFNMSRIGGKNTKPEMLIRRFLYSKGFRYRLHDKSLPGKPDIVLRKLRTLIFVHGCFWHGHENCKYFVVPKTQTGFWLDKIHRNKERDKEAILCLDKEGWKIIIIFECELKGSNQERTLSRIMENLNSILTPNQG
jgi:DNA mismatch endonuclease (patch repair protein)